MNMQSNLKGREVYVVDGSRTPFLKAKGPGLFSASDLAVACGQPLLTRQPFLPEQLDEIILGCAIPGPDEANIARVVALRLGCKNNIPAFTVMRNCASGMQALDTAAMQIASNRADLILAGGTDAMSHSPVLFNQQMASWFYHWFSAKNFSQKVKLITQLKASYFVPVIALMRGLSDPIIGMNMGQTAEELAYKFQISRSQMDEYSCQSHIKLADAYQDQRMSEVVPIIDCKGGVHLQDDGLKPDSSIAKLATLKPVFDKKYGMVTAGNSSQVSDGSCLLILASAKAIKQYNLPVLGRIVDCQWSALNPVYMGLGPVQASSAILKRHGLKLDDIDCWEINEAFAAQILACIAAWNDEKYCKEQLGLNKAFGNLPLDKLNREGGAIATGHPIGASGARIVLHALKALEQRNESKAIASICIGGGQGGAMYLERVTEVKAHG